MTVRFVRPVSRSAYLGRKLGFAAFILFAGSALAHRFGPLTGPDFMALALISALIALAAIPVCGLGLMRLWTVGARGGLAAAQGLVFLAIPLSVVGAATYAYATHPALYDVTTDPADPPPWLAIPRTSQQWLPSRLPVAAADRRLQLAAYPGFTGRRYEGALDRVYVGVQKALASARITVTRTDNLALVEPDITMRAAPRDEQAAVPDIAPIPRARPEPAPPVESGNSGDVLIQGNTRTLIFGLRFDVVIRLREDAETTSVDIRVASRYGNRDLGLGEGIAEDFLDRVDTELLGLAGG